MAGKAFAVRRFNSCFREFDCNPSGSSAKLINTELDEVSERLAERLDSPNDTLRNFLHARGPSVSVCDTACDVGRLEQVSISRLLGGSDPSR